MYEKGIAITKATINTGVLLPIVKCLVSLGAIVALQKKYTWAVWLWGKAKALYKTRDEFCKLAPHEWLLTILGTNLFYSQVVETVRTQLGEQTFTAIWNEGETMTLEQLLVEPKSQVITTPCVSKKTPGTYSDRLTPRERDVLRLLAQGMSSAQIAKQLVISLVTVNSHVRTIYSKLGVSSRSAATRYAMEHQLV
jgi:DNA-binding CsgD family transcriptional regulator